MAEAVEASCFVVICVSSSYKESANCRMEAKYAGIRKNKGLLECVYVMMDKNYTTCSSPKSVDGWLGMRVGDSLWYPLWEDASVAVTANELSSVFGDLGLKACNDAKKSSNDAIDGLVSQYPKVDMLSAPDPNPLTLTLTVSPRWICHQH